MDESASECTRRLYEDCEEEDYDWEALRGLVMSESGWNTYTGTLTQLAVEGWDQSQKRHDRQDSAPELLPGRKVARTVTFRRKVVVKIPKVASAEKAEEGEKQDSVASAKM